jgi:hypothetical protein
MPVVNARGRGAAGRRSLLLQVELGVRQAIETEAGAPQRGRDDAGTGDGCPGRRTGLALRLQIVDVPTAAALSTCASALAKSPAAKS